MVRGCDPLAANPLIRLIRRALPGSPHAPEAGLGPLTMRRAARRPSSCSHRIFSTAVSDTRTLERPRCAKWLVVAIELTRVIQKGASMPKMIFINPPVTDLDAATGFYTAIGCARNTEFSDERASDPAGMPS